MAVESMHEVDAHKREFKSDNNGDIDTNEPEKKKLKHDYTTGNNGDIDTNEPEKKEFKQGSTADNNDDIDTNEPEKKKLEQGSTADNNDDIDTNEPENKKLEQDSTADNNDDIDMNEPENEKLKQGSTADNNDDVDTNEPEKKKLEQGSTADNNDDVDTNEPENKKSNHDSTTNPIDSMETGVFLQNGRCFEVAPSLNQCIECRSRSIPIGYAICRFHAFRRLQTQNGQLIVAGFSDPYDDETKEYTSLWVSDHNNPPPELELQLAFFMISQVGDQFCDLYHQEQEALRMNLSQDKKVAWKRTVKGVREMCDVCDTTVFNFHGTCYKCGFVVCIDCYKARKDDARIENNRIDRDSQSWYLCHNEQIHNRDELMVTQIIPSDVLVTMAKLLHEIRALLNLPMACDCRMSINAYRKIMPSLSRTKVLKNLKIWKDNEKKDHDSENALCEKNKSQSEAPVLKESESSAESEEEEEDLALLNCLTSNGPPGESKRPIKFLSSMDDETIGVGSNHSQFKFFIRSNTRRVRDRIPSRVMALSSSKTTYPGVEHSWLCNGKLLYLDDPTNCKNDDLFKDQWRRGQPVLVGNVSHQLNKDLWTPESFCKDFGMIKNDLINCATGKIVPNQHMSVFWNGFEYLQHRLKDKLGNFMLLKLKDWPPGDDFAELLPSRFEDLMRVLPLKDYTQRNGKLNLASRLPEYFVRPDLGPKMYNAYGSALHPDKGTTNLHLDMSDAVNVMVYVGIPKDGGENKEIKEAATEAIREGDCDILSRIRAEKELPGALWHIYEANDSDKIRDFLNKVAIEKGARLERNHDPIHDQSWYLTSELRNRLWKEYDVRGYAIVQCMGDAVFIPAGAPHQVQNLHNCIKVAEDFVSPENIAHCFQLTEEFRGLSETHSNHEDKLQIKNIVYHAVKDSISVLMSAVLKSGVDLPTSFNDFNRI